CQSALLMNKHRQMAVKVVHLSIPLLKGDLRIDVRDSRRKDRQLYLWHAAIVATFGQKSTLLPEQNRLISLPLPTYALEKEIRSCEVVVDFDQRILEINLQRLPLIQSIVDGLAHRTLGQEASANVPPLEEPTDSCADGPALAAAISIAQRPTGSLSA